MVEAHILLQRCWVEEVGQSEICCKQNRWPYRGKGEYHIYTTYINIYIKYVSYIKYITYIT